MSGALLGLDITVDDVRVDSRAAAPTLRFGAHARTDRPVHALMLRARIVLDARRRRYTPDQEARLEEVFGERANWSRSLGPLTWADVSTTVPGFDEEARFDIPVVCSYDLELASTKFLHAADEEDIPLRFQFTGTAFTGGPSGVAVEQLSRELEATWSLPGATWSGLMEMYFPGSRWLRLGPEMFDRLVRYKAAHALPTWDATLEHLLAGTASEPSRVSA